MHVSTAGKMKDVRYQGIIFKTPKIIKSNKSMQISTK